jgi:hypothetical protein
LGGIEGEGIPSWEKLKMGALNKGSSSDMPLFSK